jgi:metallo-beta-lactamase family protein
MCKRKTTNKVLILLLFHLRYGKPFPMDITFLGASGTVTGSKYLLQVAGRNILVDCGLFQGEREWRDKNWEDPPIRLEEIDAVLITHAHIDHVGLLPRWVARGLKCPVYCSLATQALSKLLLLDSGRLQEEEARYRLESGRSRHSPPLPLYTEEDAKQALELFEPIDLNERIPFFSNDLAATWTESGHILGACSIFIEGHRKSITFSGDIGRYEDPITRRPHTPHFGNLMLIESTYGDRLHPETNVEGALAEVIERTYARGGSVIVPSFAVGRTQLLLYYIRELKEKGKIPDLPIVVDSPMARDATSIYLRFPSLLGVEAKAALQRGKQPFLPSNIGFVRDRTESIRLNKVEEPMVIISASGMMSGGRVLHHVRNRIADSRNTILFVGFQPPGGKGDRLLKGAKTIRIFKDELPVNAEIASISGLSAHGDYEELLRWCGEGRGTPNKVMIVHGEPSSAKNFQGKLKDKFHWNVEVAWYKEKLSF